MKSYGKYFLIALLVVGLDQALKMWVYFNMEMGNGQEIHIIGDWFRLHYLLNKGMAFGLELPQPWGKLLLTVFRLVAIGAIANYIYRLYQRKAHAGLLVSLALILGGAVGNAIDSMFYGIWLDNAPAEAPFAFLHGQVIDMLFFPMWRGHFPEWFPWVGGENFLFFRPVFNLADSFIFIGVVFILLRQRTFFADMNKSEDDEEDKPEQPTHYETNATMDED